RSLRAGPGRTAAGSLLGAPVRVPEPEGQTHQNRVLGWHRPAALAQKSPRVNGLLIVDFVNGFSDPAIFGGGNIPAAIEKPKEWLAHARRQQWPTPSAE
ncbi:MAG: hypothetical protein ABSA39_23815, partial [Edaphobacter sp.]